MLWLETHWLRLLFLLAYLAMLVYHCWPAWSARREAKNDAGQERKTKRAKNAWDDYITGGGKLGGWVIALSFYATYVSTNTFVGQAGKSWDAGLIWYVKLPVYALSAYLAWRLVAPRFITLAQQYHSSTVADFLGHHYQSPALRRIAAAVILVAATVYLVAVYKGSALALQAFLGLDYRVAIVAVFLVVTSYTLAGGFRAVVLTDAVQGLLMAVGAVVMLVAVLYQGGGLPAVLEELRAQKPEPWPWRGEMPLMAILGLSLASGMKLLVDPRQISRFYGLRDHTDERPLRLATIVAPLLIASTYFCMLPIGALSHVLIPAKAIHDSDQVIPYLLGTSEVLGPVLSSFFLLVLLSAALSSLDSVLLVGASAVERDLIFQRDHTATTIGRTRLWVMLLSLVSMLMALNPFGGIVEITAFSGSLYAACFFPTLVVGMYWSRRTAAGALACMLAGSVIVVGWYFAKRAAWTTWHEVYAGLSVAILSYVVVSLLTSQAGRDEVSNG
jgi:SSS family transporter